MKRTIFLNRYFYPDHSATSQILTDVAFHLTRSGIETHVITSQQLYDDPDARLSSEETLCDVHIHRVSSTQFGRTTLLGRSIDYLAFYCSTWRTLRSLARPGDIVVAKTDPPLISIIAMFAIRARKAHMVNWLQDIYPEVAIRLNVPLVNSSIGRIFFSILRNRSLKAAKANVVVGQQMVAHVLFSNAASDRVHVIHNWTNDEAIRPVSQSDNPLRRKWQLEDKFVVGYSGNLGRAHDFDTVLAASKRLKNRLYIIFVCIGGGSGFDELRRTVEQQGLDRSFRFFPYQDHSILKYSLGVADVHWISLKPEVEGLIFPSKFYGAAAAGRPIIAISAENGELAQLINQHRCGVVIKPGNSEALAQTILELAGDRQRVADMGRRARDMLDLHFSRRQALESWRGLLAAL
jgi:colanic acid biosynthesis glycosyl transferase WcaI